MHVCRWSIHTMTVTISMPAAFRRHLVGKTLRNAWHCDVAEIRFVGKLVIKFRHFFINRRVELYLNNKMNLRPLTPHIMPCYTHKMAIVSWPWILWRHFTLCVNQNWARPRSLSTTLICRPTVSINNWRGSLSTWLGALGTFFGYKSARTSNFRAELNRTNPPLPPPPKKSAPTSWVRPRAERRHAASADRGQFTSIRARLTT